MVMLCLLSGVVDTTASCTLKKAQKQVNNKVNHLVHVMCVLWRLCPQLLDICSIMVN